MGSGSVSFIPDAGQIEQAELYRFFGGNEFGRTDAEQPYGSSVPELVKKRAGGPVDRVAAGGGAWQYGLM